ncbi:MAG TPA: CRISPR-associated endonuclease Cas1, partial [Nakamurella sp.]|nr:CRISPR-associated endonuclease Cas1 [Nakamurella sp.]
MVTASREDAWEAARLCTHVLEGLGMELGADKTEVMSFDEGFCFVGEDFGPRYPPTLSDAGLVVPERRVLYVSHQGSRVRTAGGRLIVESEDDAKLLDLPTELVSRLVCFGSIGVSAGVRAWAMVHDVDVVFA